MTKGWENLGQLTDPAEIIESLQAMSAADIARALAKIVRTTAGGPNYERFREPAAIVANEKLVARQVETAERLSDAGNLLTKAAIALAFVQAAAAAVALWTFFHR